MNARGTSSLHRDLRAMIGDAVAFSVMVGLGETYLPAFVLAAGLGEIAAGLVTTLPMLVGAVIQLVTPAAVRRLRSHRRWVVLAARIQAASFVPLGIGAFLGGISLEWVFAAAAVYWGAGMATSPAWNAWVATLVPPVQRPRFFARRSRWAQAALLAGIAGGGLVLHELPSWSGTLAAFGCVFALAASARLVSAGFLSRQSEPHPVLADQRNLSPAEFVAGLFRSRSGAVLAYLLAMQVAVHLAAPFFTPYLLGPLALSYGAYTLLTAVAFLARVVALPTLGRLAHRWGTRRLLWLGGAGIVPLPVLWTLSSHVGYLAAVQVFAGLAWGALELATLLAFFEGLETRERVSILTWFNLANAVALALGSLVGGAVFWSLGGGPGGGGGEAYLGLFVLSALGRALPLLLLLRVPTVMPTTTPEVRTLAVRPNAGALQRPILATLDADGSADAEPEGRP